MHICIYMHSADVGMCTCVYIHIYIYIYMYIKIYTWIVESHASKVMSMSVVAVDTYFGVGSLHNSGPL